MEVFRYLHIFTASKNVEQRRCFKRLSRPPRNKWPGHEDLLPAQLPSGAITHFTGNSPRHPKTWEILRRYADPSKYAKKNTFWGGIIGCLGMSLGELVRIFVSTWNLNSFWEVSSTKLVQFNLPSQGLPFGIRKHSGIKHRNGSSFRQPFPRGTLQWWKQVHLKQINQIRITSEQ